MKNKKDFEKCEIVVGKCVSLFMEYQFIKDNYDKPNDKFYEFILEITSLNEADDEYKVFIFDFFGFYEHWEYSKIDFKEWERILSKDFRVVDRDKDEYYHFIFTFLTHLIFNMDNYSLKKTLYYCNNMLSDDFRFDFSDIVEIMRHSSIGQKFINDCRKYFDINLNDCYFME
jgi:hypothetical protein